MGELIVSPLRTLDKAIGTLREIGLLPEADAEEAPVVALIQQIAEYDEEKAIAIARTLSQVSWFNEVVRNEIKDVRIGARYEKITQSFDTIRDDAKAMVDHLADGKIGVGEKLSQFWMKATRGTIPDRFDDIKKTYIEVSKDSKDQIIREQRIIDAYRDFRGALKESQVLAWDLLKVAEVHLERDKRALEAAAKVLETPPEDQGERARLELDRDNKLRILQETDKKYQLAKDLADNLTVSYNTTEIVMARLVQTTEIKERVYAQSVTFFGTNETVFTALNAAFTSMHGLHESTETLEAMKEGVNKSLETVAEVGDKVQIEGIKAGYGATIRAESVKKLVDAVVNYQATAAKLIAEMREEATTNAEAIHTIVEDGKQRLVELRQQVNVVSP